MHFHIFTHDPRHPPTLGKIEKQSLLKDHGRFATVRVGNRNKNNGSYVYGYEYYRTIFTIRIY